MLKNRNALIPIKAMSLHDRTVYKIGKNELKNGAESITIGDRVVDRLAISLKLKKQFPKSRVFTYFNGAELEWMSP